MQEEEVQQLEEQLKQEKEALQLMGKDNIQQWREVLSELRDVDDYGIVENPDRIYYKGVLRLIPYKDLFGVYIRNDHYSIVESEGMLWVAMVHTAVDDRVWTGPCEKCLDELPVLHRCDVELLHGKLAAGGCRITNDMDLDMFFEMLDVWGYVDALDDASSQSN